MVRVNYFQIWYASAHLLIASLGCKSALSTLKMSRLQLFLGVFVLSLLSLSLHIKSLSGFVAIGRLLARNRVIWHERFTVFVQTLYFGSERTFLVYESLLDSFVSDISGQSVLVEKIILGWELIGLWRRLCVTKILLLVHLLTHFLLMEIAAFLWVSQVYRLLAESCIKQVLRVWERYHLLSCVQLWSGVVRSQTIRSILPSHHKVLHTTLDHISAPLVDPWIEVLVLLLIVLVQSTHLIFLLFLQLGLFI